jgi:hypothetical protein
MRRDLALCPATDREHDAVIEQRAPSPRDSVLVCRACGAWRPLLAACWEAWKTEPVPPGEYWILP